MEKNSKNWLLGGFILLLLVLVMFLMNEKKVEDNEKAATPIAKIRTRGSFVPKLKNDTDSKSSVMAISSLVKELDEKPLDKEECLDLATHVLAINSQEQAEKGVKEDSKVLATNTTAFTNSCKKGGLPRPLAKCFLSQSTQDGLLRCSKDVPKKMAKRHTFQGAQ